MTGRQRPLKPEEVASLSPLVLAYVGDAVYELFVRNALLSPGVSVERLHKETVSWVSAAGQERVWQQVQGELTPDEAHIARRGRNAKSSVPQKVTVSTYRRSTSLEALVGYLYLTGRSERIETLLSQAVACRVSTEPEATT